MSGPAPCDRRRSTLTTELLTPVIAGALVLAALGAAATSQISYSLAAAHLRDKAQHVAHATAHAADTVSAESSLIRFVNSLGADPEVSLIVAVGGDPLRVLASTRNAWIGRRIDALPKHGVADCLVASLIGRGELFDARRGDHEVDVTIPMVVSCVDNRLSNGAVMVHVDGRPAWRHAIALGSGALAIELAILLAAAAALWLHLRVTVVTPLRSIADQIRADGEDAEIRVRAHGEIAWLGSALNEANAIARRSKVDLEAARAAADDRRDELQALLHATPGVLYRCRQDADRTMEFVSEGAQKLLGRPPSDFIHNAVRSFASVIHPDDALAVAGGVNSAVERGEEWEISYRVIRADGAVRWVLERGRAVSRPNSVGPPPLIGFLVDVTEAREASEAMRRAQQEAEAASRSKSEFLANMSHEIRTPMTAILGFAELLDTDEDFRRDPKTMSDAIQTIRANAAHLLGILNDILDMSKIEAGKMTVDRVAVDAAALIRDVVAMMHVRAAAKSLRLSVALESDMPATIQTDPVRLRQVLMNLVGNALKFTELGGVTLRVSADFERRRLRIAVVDTGIGIAASDLPKLFAPFGQADSSATRRYGGTGLGLLISRRFANMLGGDITVESAPGKGSTFTLEVDTGPIRPEARGSAPSASASSDAPAPVDPPTPLAGARILLVEDGPDNQRIIALHLRKAGAAVDVVENGRLAVERFTIDGSLDGALRQPPPFDLVVTDMQMPVMDGYASVRLLRGKGCMLPIIALTAHALSSDEQKCLDAGCDDYTTKPIDRRRLIDVCRSALARAASRGEPAPPARGARFEPAAL